MIAELWNALADGRKPTLEQRARCRLAAVHAGDCARQAMDLMYRHGGSTSFEIGSRLAEVWRDLQVVSQAATLAPEWCPIGGRAFLGLDPAPRRRWSQQSCHPERSEGPLRHQERSIATFGMTGSLWRGRSVTAGI